MIKAKFRDGLVVLLPLPREALEDPLFRPTLEEIVREKRRQYEASQGLWCSWEWED